MKRKTTSIAAIVIMVSLDAGATESIRCGNRLVLVGDSKIEVRQKCGAPDDITRSGVAERVSSRSYIPIGRVDVVEHEVQKEAEAWLYNFGPNRFMSRLRFVDGRLVAIETLGYGYDP